MVTLFLKLYMHVYIVNMFEHKPDNKVTKKSRRVCPIVLTCEFVFVADQCK